MSTAAARRRTTRTRRTTRRRVVALAVGAVIAALAAVVVFFGDEVRELTLPLRHDDIIRQQAADKGLDPALIAAIIYEESRFRDQTSHAGARGLMQVTPETARFIARDSGGTEFVEGDLATPQINIAYGSYFLRYLLEKYDGDRELAIAAYNAGETNVNKWLVGAGADFEVDDIRFPETRAYVENVLERRDDYADHYADDLGL
jgi:soluble lytic murein transglycosylase